MSKSKVSKIAKIVYLDFSKTKISEKKSLIRSLGSRARTKGGIRKMWRKYAKASGGNYDNHARAWRFEVSDQIAKVERVGNKIKKEFSHVPLGMKASIGRDKKLKLSFGSTGMYELAVVSGEDILDRPDFVVAELIAGYNAGKKIGCKYFRIRLGQSNAFWRMRSFDAKSIVDEIQNNLLTDLMGSDNGFLALINVYLYGFTTEKNATKFVLKSNKIRKEQKFIRKRLRKQRL